jgi:hypothetical protein
VSVVIRFGCFQTLDADQQVAHVNDVRQAVRFAVSDLKGSELLPGFCLPKVNLVDALNQCERFKILT